MLDGWGLGYDVLRAIKPDIIYAQQSGMGTAGTYGRFRAVGPVAAALAGTSEMSGLPEPGHAGRLGLLVPRLDRRLQLRHRDAGRALPPRPHRARASASTPRRCETGIFLAGVPMLDWSANGREFQRSGNRSPYKPAAPHGAYRCAGDDRWIAIACFTDDEWAALAKVAGRPEWLDRRPVRARSHARLANQDALDAAIDELDRASRTATS